VICTDVFSAQSKERSSLDKYPDRLKDIYPQTLPLALF